MSKASDKPPKSEPRQPHSYPAIPPARDVILNMSTAATDALRRRPRRTRNRKPIKKAPAIDARGRLATKLFKGERIEAVAATDSGAYYLEWMLKRLAPLIAPHWQNKIRIVLAARRLQAAKAA